MTLSPDAFKDALERSFTDEPGQPGVADDVRRGRSTLRRRRLVRGGVAAAAVVLASGAVYGLAGGTDGAPDTAVADNSSDVSSDNAALLEACLGGENSQRAVDAVFAGGTPRVVRSATTGDVTLAALLSADGRHWASCFVTTDPDAEFAASMEVYDSIERTTALTYGGSDPGSCEGQHTCDFTVRWVDRLPAMVARVRYVTADGVTTTVETINGFTLLNRAGTAPIDPDDPTAAFNFSALHRVDYLASDGTLLAAMALDGSGSGPDGEKIDGVPLVTSIPSLHGDPLV